MSRIAIVGAGMAGLNAALTLRDFGLSCDIYEASDRVGGRMHSDILTWADGQVGDRCGEFIDADHATIHQLITRFGLDTIALDQGSAGRVHDLLYFFDRFYDAEELTRDFHALAPLLKQQVQEIGSLTTYSNFTQVGLQLDHLSAYEWIEQYVAGGHATPIGRYLDAACSEFHGMDTDEQSALNLVYMFGSLDAAKGSIIPQSRQGSSKIMGGSERLPLAIAHSLPDRRIHLGHRLVALERTTDASLTLTFATADGSLQVFCDHVILALPFSALRRVDYQRAGFDLLKRTAIDQLGYGTISKLFLQFDRSYWYDDGPWPRNHSGFLVTDMAIQTLWDASLGQTGAHGLLVIYTSGRRGAAFIPSRPYTTSNDSASVQLYARECLLQLERIFPGISAHYTGRAALSYPTGEPYLLGSYACWRVGQYTQFGGYEGVRQGCIYFAGEHCSYEFQGYMEGAAQEGARAAREIAQDMR